MMTPDETPQIDLAAYDALSREVPVLARLKRYATGLTDRAWFARLGEAPRPSVREAAQDFTLRLGFPDATLAILRDWEEAAEAAETADWAAPAWEAEELLRADLTGVALSVLSEEAFEIAQNLIAKEVADSAKAAMEEQAALWDMVDEGAMTLAVGAVAQAAHQGGLLLIAAAADPEFDVHEHAFASKLRLFELGRWPVAVIGTSFSVF